MELYEANRILRAVKVAFTADGVKLPPQAETDGLMLLLGKLNGEKAVEAKLKRIQRNNLTAYKRETSYITFLRALTACVTGIPAPATTISFTMLNRVLYADYYAGAGRTRQKPLTEFGSEHTDPKYIQSSIKSIVAKMNGVQCSPIIGKEDFAGYLTHFMREMIILHPFEYGSEFTLRLFMMLFCKIKGFALCYYRCPPAAVKKAESEAFLADDVTALFKIFADCLSYEQTTEKRRSYPMTTREINKKKEREKLNSSTKKDTTKTEKNYRPPAAKNTENKSGEKIANATSGEKAQLNDDEKLKKAIRLQQKISRLNDQLTELMDGNDVTDKTDKNA